MSQIKKDPETAHGSGSRVELLSGSHLGNDAGESGPGRRIDPGTVAGLYRAFRKDECQEAGQL